MKIFKSHFWYNKNQRNGIFLLCIIIIILQIIIFSKPFSSKESIDVNSPELLAFQQQIDSLKQVEIENRKPKIYPFNPNYITDFKGERLGMSLQEIDRLLSFRKTGKFINSKKEFQKVTKVSDSLLHKIAPYFKFPDWVVKRNQQKNISKNISTPISKNYQSDNYKISTIDINKATQEDFLIIKGVNNVIAERIIKYRSKLQGFYFENQLYEVWGLDKNIADNLLETFTIIEKPIIKKYNINTVNFKELLKNPYIDYELCKKIFDYRDEVAELQSLTKLKNIKGFPLDKYDRIVLYLLAK